MRAAVYHHTGSRGIRQGVVRKDLRVLTDYAHLLGYDDITIYCDTDGRSSTGRPELERLLQATGQYNAVIVRNLFHLDRHTGPAIAKVMSFADAGAVVYTLDGDAWEIGKAPMKDHLSAAVYISSIKGDHAHREEKLQTDILRCFVKEKTMWTIGGVYSDPRTEKQSVLGDGIQAMIRDRDKYDLLLIHSLKDIHDNTAAFERIWRQLQISIFALQEGFFLFKDIKK